MLWTPATRAASTRPGRAGYGSGSTLAGGQGLRGLQLEADLRGRQARVHVAAQLSDPADVTAELQAGLDFSRGLVLDAEALDLNLRGLLLSSASPSRVMVQDGTITVPALQLSGSLGILEVSGRLAPDGDSDASLSLELPDLDALSARFPEWLPSLHGGLESTLRASGTGAAPSLLLSLQGTGLGSGEMGPVDAALELRSDGERVGLGLELAEDGPPLAAIDLELPLAVRLDGPPQTAADGAIRGEARLADMPVADLGLLLPDLRSHDGLGSLHDVSLVLDGTVDRPELSMRGRVSALQLGEALDGAPVRPFHLEVAARAENGGISGHAELRQPRPVARLFGDAPLDLSRLLRDQLSRISQVTPGMGGAAEVPALHLVVELVDLQAALLARWLPPCVR